MANSKEIKRRMQSIANTRQITSAMKMVSASKLRRAQSLVGSGEPYRKKLKEVLAQVAASLPGEVSDPLLDVRPVQREGFLVFASNKGLAGGYNNNLLAVALQEAEAARNAGHEVGIIAVGRKTMEYFKKRGFEVDEVYLNTSDVPYASDSITIAKALRTAYSQGKYDKVTMVYQEFRSAMSQRPIVVPLLPVTTEEMQDPSAAQSAFEVDYIFEISAAAILSELLPLYLNNQIHAALCNAKAGEHGARMTAMTAATDNASDLLDQLRISYNRARQSAITNEITEIVAGADALG